MTYTTTYTIGDITHKWKTNNKIDGVDANGVLHMAQEEDRIYKLLLEMLEWFQDLAKVNDIKWFAMSGTLLGACRNKGIIPHDDDIDLGVHINEYFKLKKLCEDKSGKYSIRIASTCGFNVYQTSGTKFPFIDIFVLAEEKGRLIYAAPFYKDKPTFYTSRTFPLEWIEQYDIDNLKTTKFERLVIPIPNNSDKWLKRVYGDDCYTRYVPDGRIPFIHNVIDLIPTDELCQGFGFVTRDVLNLDKSDNPDAHIANISYQGLANFMELNQNPIAKINKFNTLLYKFIDANVNSK